MPSPKKVTLADIARKTGLSKGAVSFALKNSPMVSEKTRKRVQAAAGAMGYRKNELVSSLMSKIRGRSAGTFSETIAVINGNLDESALKSHPTLPRYYAGIREEAARLGYAVNEFWMHAPGTGAEKLAKIFRSRSIRGGIVLGHSFGNVFPKGFEKIWRDFYFISAGIRSYSPSLEVVASDDFLISYNSYTEVAGLGYKNIGLVIDESVDDLVGGTLVGGFLRAQLKGGARFRCPPFLEERGSKTYRANLAKWIRENGPDAILYLFNFTRGILRRIPEVGRKNIRLFQLERREPPPPGWTGMEQNNDIVGRVAVRRLADMLSRGSAVAGENSNIITLVRPTWIGDGETAKGKPPRSAHISRPGKAEPAK